MAQLAAREVAGAGSIRQGQAPRAQVKPVKIIAKTLFRQLRSNGYDDGQIVALSAELISLLTTDIRDDER